MRVYKKDEEQSLPNDTGPAAPQGTVDTIMEAGDIETATANSVGPVEILPTTSDSINMDVTMSSPAPSITSEESIGTRYLFDEEELLNSENESEEDSALDVTVVDTTTSKTNHDAGTTN
ncbi:uncharacterized protein LOC119689889 [Teleopsis dalmanni]|uniref:uncharacterized protein LOC119664090 n=1 Tax=Teleopsis dalmanni TaxID=139649 RepID=UPI0018CE3DD4|nr:uncharacterized protein LOC119664090 [Teleopsis dalmanni]XP_037960744.1 uncharacterized protein LOC119689889 [Teleopsis dalmanni]